MIVLRDYQLQAVQSVFDYYASGKVGNPVVAEPTGTGKSVVIAEFCKRVLHQWNNTRIVVVTHRQELIESNAKAMLAAWPTAPVGIYSAGLAMRDTMQSIIFGGVQSMVNNVAAFGLRHLILIDEAHLVSPKDESNYQRLIAGFRVLNPNCKVIGFTATDYRTGQGKIAGVGNLFSDVCCDQCSMEKFNWFISEGYLVPLIPKKTMTELDVSNVGITNGDYSKDELQKACDQYGITYQCSREIMEYAAQRRSWLIFASGIEHSCHVAECLQTLGINAVALHSKLHKDKRKEIITGFMNRAIRCVVNNDVLTTGFNFPGLDFIGMLRPTASVGLWVQMLGRLTRPEYAPGYDLSTKEGRLAAIAHSQKQNGLVLDFAGNTRRLGPINDPIIPKKRIKGTTPGVAPIKICPHCGTYNHASATECANPACAHAFERQSKLTTEASQAELIRSDAPIYNDLTVERILYSKMLLKGKPPAMKVSYFCGLNHAKEVLFFENIGFARTKARQWWRQRSTTDPPNSIDEALAQQQFLREPKGVRVHSNKTYPEIVEYIW
jgi:DNA repair protein RadD